MLLHMCVRDFDIPAKREKNRGISISKLFFSILENIFCQDGLFILYAVAYLYLYGRLSSVFELHAAMVLMHIELMRFFDPLV